MFVYLRKGHFSCSNLLGPMPSDKAPEEWELVKASLDEER
jgi:hypothetical protein